MRHWQTTSRTRPNTVFIFPSEKRRAKAYPQVKIATRPSFNRSREAYLVQRLIPNRRLEESALDPATCIRDHLLSVQENRFTIFLCHEIHLVDEHKHPTHVGIEERRKRDGNEHLLTQFHHHRGNFAISCEQLMCHEPHARVMYRRLRMDELRR